MDLKSKKILVASLEESYRKGSFSEKKQILDHLIKAASYERKYASYILLHSAKIKRGKVIKARRIYTSKYAPIQRSLEKLWGIANFACGKRLKIMLPSYLETLTRDNEITVSKDQHKLLLKISASTIDRVLKGERRKVLGKGRSTTRPGTLLKNQIPIQVFTKWDERKAGFEEIDLVAHCGPTARGDFAYTLDFIDLYLCWNECRAFLGRGEKRCLEAISEIEERLPTDLLGIDSDNDYVFINWHLFRYCEGKKITFTRCRTYHKNDQAHVEEKNWSVVRKYVGYRRLDTQEQVDILNKFYDVLRIYYNFFQANMQLSEKVREGAKVKRVYPSPKTPYQRVLECSSVTEEKKEELRKIYQTNNPAKLLREMQELLELLNKS